METTSISRNDPKLQLDVNSRRNFIKFHNKLKEKCSTTVRFFERGDYYSVHDEGDCELIGKIVYKSTAYIRDVLPDDKSATLRYVTLSKKSFEQAIRELLLVRNFRVEVYIRNNGGAEDWHLEYRGSPGNLLQFEDILFTFKEVLVGNKIMSLYTKQVGADSWVGIATIDQNDFCFELLEFIDEHFHTELEATIVLLEPKECIVPQVDGEYAKACEVLTRNGILITHPKKSTSSEQQELFQDLDRLLKFQKGQQEDARALPEIKMQFAMEALRSAIKHLGLTSDSTNFGQYKIKKVDLKRFVHLDSAAVRALNVLPKASTQHTMASYRWQSLLGVLDHCRTPQGHRLIGQWIRQPLRSRDLIEHRHNIVQCFLESPSTLDTLHNDFLKRIPDVLMLTKKMMRRKSTLMDLFRVYQVILRTPKIINELYGLGNVTVDSVLCVPLKSLLEDLFGLKQMVEQVVDFEAIETGEYLVKASFDAQLLELKEQMSELLTKMERLQAKCASELNLERGQQVRLENVAKLGYHFRITLKDDSVLRKNKNYKIVDVVKGGVRFTSDKLTGYSEEYNELCNQYSEQQQSIVEEIMKVANGYASPLNLLNNEIAQLDCLLSLAIAARSAPIPYVRPKLCDEGTGVLKLKGLRHPCLELQEHVTFIANDIELDKDDTTMLIITGPNMGGKSTFIRSVGVAVLMAHIGSFVPCSEATISIVDCILGRVGASDNIAKGLSTFMVEMIETAAIMTTSTANSLVIIDELGRGTSTYEGCSMAWSIAEQLAREKRCFTLFATHFNELTELGSTDSNVKNCHMAAVADERNFTLLYQVRPGATNQSYGLKIASLANLPESVVQHAHIIYNEFADEDEPLQTEEDKNILRKLQRDLEALSNKNDNKIGTKEIDMLIEQLKDEIKQTDSAYFKTKQSNIQTPK